MSELQLENAIKIETPWRAIVVFLACSVIYISIEVCKLDPMTIGAMISTVMAWILITIISLPSVFLLAVFVFWFSTKTYWVAVVTVGKFMLYLNSCMILLLALEPFIGAGKIETLTTADIVYSFDSVHVSEQDLKVLKARLNAIKPSSFSRVTINENTGTIIFSQGTPNEELIRFVSENKGEFLFYRKNPYQVWVTNEDVRRVEATEFDDGVPEVRMSLTQEGALKLYRFTSLPSSQQTLAYFSIDGRELQPATINGALSRRFQARMASVEEAQALALLLNYGTLSEPISLTKVAE